jgi:hypothetical protein
MTAIEKVKEIHAAFDEAADVLAKEAYAFLLVHKEQEAQAITYGKARLLEIEQKTAAIKYDSLQRAEQLISLGFTNAAEVVESKKMKDAAERERNFLELQEHNAQEEHANNMYMLAKRKRDADKVLFYKKTYPHLKFISETQLEQLCKKYNLAYAPVSNYIGYVPQKNLDEIARANVIAERDAHELRFSITGRYSSESATLEVGKRELEAARMSGFQDWHAVFGKRMGLKCPFLSDYTVTELNKDKSESLFIAADQSLFSYKGLEKSDSGFGLFKKQKTVVVVNPDPIVFRYVKGGILVISKWGAEAEDEMLQINREVAQ